MDLARHCELRGIVSRVGREGEDVSWLPEILVAHSSIEREGRSQLPAVLHEQRPAEQVWTIDRAAELLRDIALIAGEIVDEVRERFHTGAWVVGHDGPAIDRRRLLRQLPQEFHSGTDGVFPANHPNSVLILIVVGDASLGEGARGAE